MSGPISPDATAGDVSPAVGLGARVSRSGNGVVSRVARRWWVIAATVLVAVIVGFVYILVTPATYTATCVLAPDQRLAVGAGSANVPPDEFLYAQRDLILSPGVLASAVDALDSAA